MSKTAVETAVCDICGVEVREGSQFCYNCGGSVAKAVEAEPIPVPDEPIVPDDTPANGHPRGVNYDPAKRRAERAERRKVRAAGRPPVEIVWEPRTGGSWWFVFTAVVFLVITLVLVIAAYFVK